MNTSPIRISGLASGMDTEAIIKKLMDAERIPVNTMKQKRDKLAWQSEAYRQWNTDVLSFRTNTLFEMKLSGKYGTFSSTVSDANKLTVTPTAEALVGTYAINVTQLAQSATINGSVPADFDADKKLSEQATNPVTTDFSLDITVKNAAGETLTTSIAVSKDDKVSDFISKLSSATDSNGKNLGIQASYDKSLKKLIIKTKDTGEKTEISLSSTDATGYGQLKALFSLPNSGDVIKGKDANYEFSTDGGATFTTGLTSSSNDIAVLGVNYTLRTTGSSNVTITRDLDAEIKNIKEFVDKYNEFLDKLNKAIDEPVYRQYQPLTDEERKVLSDKQIEQWEQKAKSGLLRRDSTLMELANKMRSSATLIVDTGSKYNSLASIGIKSTSYTDKGKLTVDETKLRAALQEDPDAVKRIFTLSSTEEDAPTSEKGVITRLYDQFGETIEKLTEKAGAIGNAQTDNSMIGKLLRDLDQQIYRKEDLLIKKENNYYKQFAAMEKAMSKYNSQSSWFAQQFGGGM